MSVKSPWACFIQKSLKALISGSLSWVNWEKAGAAVDTVTFLLPKNLLYSAVFSKVTKNFPGTPIVFNDWFWEQGYVNSIETVRVGWKLHSKLDVLLIT